MLRKNVFAVFVAVVAVVAAAAVFSGCSKAVKSNTLRGYSIDPKIESSVTLADLEVSEVKVAGVAKGRLMPPVVTKATLIDDALEQAIKQKEGSDVLVGATYFYETVGREMTVTITGYPARFKNFRAKADSGSASRRADVVVEHRVNANGAVPPVIPVPAARASEE